MIKFKIKSGDVVRVISGGQKGKEGEVIKVITKENKVIIKGVNLVSKHIKPGTKNPQGGIIKKEAPLPISNVALLEDGNIIKLGYRLEDGKKVRFSKKTNKTI